MNVAKNCFFSFFLFEIWVKLCEIHTLKLFLNFYFNTFRNTFWREKKAAAVCGPACGTLNIIWLFKYNVEILWLGVEPENCSFAAFGTFEEQFLKDCILYTRITNFVSKQIINDSQGKRQIMHTAHSCFLLST